jgi:uroporphyrinogen III methyltransferase/synthase
VTVGLVQLVGAGPGDPKLLTVRAMECLERADVVAYDELVTQAILALCPPDCERLAVGRRHRASVVSYRLHPDVLARARAGKRVVRLKAGDPLVFGRGGEEAEELAAAGIPFEIVPGVSAALGAAASAGIPLTHREHASQVTFMTGHHAADSLARSSLAPPIEGTLVLFMAAHKLGPNLKRLRDQGRAKDTPAAYVAAATTPQERVVVGTIGDLADRVGDVDPALPAVVIVGDVVSARRPPRRAP